jgi:hypothetical protein
VGLGTKGRKGGVSGTTALPGARAKLIKPPGIPVMKVSFVAKTDAAASFLTEKLLSSQYRSGRKEKIRTNRKCS